MALNNPLCLFQMSGRLALFLRVYITIGISPFSVSVRLHAGRRHAARLQREAGLRPPPPHLGGVTGDTLVVYAGALGNDALRGDPVGQRRAQRRRRSSRSRQLHTYANPAGGTAKVATDAGVEVDMLGITES